MRSMFFAHLLRYPWAVKWARNKLSIMSTLNTSFHPNLFHSKVGWEHDERGEDTCISWSKPCLALEADRALPCLVKYVDGSHPPLVGLKSRLESTVSRTAPIHMDLVRRG